VRVISHIPTAQRLRSYTDISNGRTTLTFLTGSNRNCKRKVEVSGFSQSGNVQTTLPKVRFGRKRLGLVTMSGREPQRIEVLSEVLARRRTEISAAAILGLSTRQTRRLLTAYRDGGGGALIHKARGHTSNSHLIPGIREYVIELVRSRYADCGPPWRQRFCSRRMASRSRVRRYASGWLRSPIRATVP
jgi:hypothetical protein